MTQSVRMRRLAFSLALIAFVALLVVAIVRSLPPSAPTTSATVTPATHSHAFYLFSPQLLVPSGGTVQLGQSLTVLWIPQLQPNASVEGPAPADCSVTLYGPFASRDAAQHADVLLYGGGPTATPDAASVPLAYAAPALTLDGGTSTQIASTLTVPDSVAPGYYLLVALATSEGIPTLSDAVLTIVRGAT